MRTVVLTLILILSCSFFASALDASDEKAVASMFPEVKGIPKAEGPTIYVPENLYRYIDGAADVYLSYGFQDLAVLFYENEEGQSLTAEVYRHIDRRHGFGIYASERPQVGDFLDIGVQGYYEEGILNFVRGSYYVKLSSFKLGDDDSLVLVGVAKDVAARLEGELEFPEILSSFPRQGKVENSERFIPLDFIGYSFLRTAYTCEYEVEDARFRMFVIEEADSASCEETLRTYLGHIKHPESSRGEGSITVEDPHHGTVGLLQEGRYIWGLLGLEDPKTRSEYFTLIQKGFKRNQ